MAIFSFFGKKDARPVSPYAPDFLVVGQGLAGTLLTFALEARGFRVRVVDDAWKTAASRITAGLVNPIPGIRPEKAHGTDDLLPAAKRVYAALGERFGETFFYELPIYRFYASEHERDVKAARAAQPEYADWFSEDVPAGTLCGGGLTDRFGGFFVRHAGRLDLPKLLERARDDFRARGVLIEENFSHGDVEVPHGGAGTRWRGNEFRRGIIFCEGFRVRENPWFSHLKWQPAKGEFVEIELAGSEKFQAQILKKTTVAVPIGGARWLVGTTCDREVIDTVPTPEVGARLSRAFCSLFAATRRSGNATAGTGTVKILAHRAGVRPSVQGAIPKVGAHERFPTLFLFNGFGAQGVSRIPLYAERFAEKLAARRERA